MRTWEASEETFDARQADRANGECIWRIEVRCESGNEIRKSIVKGAYQRRRWPMSMSWQTDHSANCMWTTDGERKDGQEMDSCQVQHHEKRDREKKTVFSLFVRQNLSADRRREEEHRVNRPSWAFQERGGGGGGCNVLKMGKGGKRQHWTRQWPSSHLSCFFSPFLTRT